MMGLVEIDKAKLLEEVQQHWNESINGLFLKDDDINPYLEKTLKKLRQETGISDLIIIHVSKNFKFPSPLYTEKLDNFHVEAQLWSATTPLYMDVVIITKKHFNPLISLLPQTRENGRLWDYKYNEECGRYYLGSENILKVSERFFHFKDF